MDEEAVFQTAFFLKEFLYTEAFFIRSFTKSFEDIARDAGVVLENFFVDNDIHGEDIY